MDSIIKLAINQALKVEIYRRRNTTFRLGAVLFHKNNVINTGRNFANKTHPKSNSPFKNIHAEFDAIISVPRFLLEGASLMVVRIGMTNDLLMARPCSDCYSLIKKVGIKRLYYSTNQGKIEYARVN